jgi:hypothetical protein
VSYKLGGADFLGNEPEIDFESESVWDYLMVTVGAYGYFGRNATLTASVADKSNNFYRAGVDLDVLYKRLRGKFSGVKGRDGNPNFLATASEVKSYALASEAEFLIGSQVIAAFRYEYQDDDKGITRRYIPAVAYVPLQNIRLILEYKQENAAVATDRIAQLGITFSF